MPLYGQCWNIDIMPMPCFAQSITTETVALGDASQHSAIHIRDGLTY
ncbi:hypothetical protein Mal64_35150 [Pseudobythopirellula maris]|uniref:Uncharacterized protein n=1 Tax=Pseudobythopirellula maris TaxID=2527991 RepID=A0A5C5ZHJ7_9BACT|nr:hypothetical protein Mal64_35150 [Pseudobythopirellula maris]